MFCNITSKQNIYQNYYLFFRTNLLMRSYCEEAVKFGDEILPPHQRPRHVTVILNPISNKK